MKSFNITVSKIRMQMSITRHINFVDVVVGPINNPDMMHLLVFTDEYFVSWLLKDPDAPKGLCINTLKSVMRRLGMKYGHHPIKLHACGGLHHDLHSNSDGRQTRLQAYYASKGFVGDADAPHRMTADYMTFVKGPRVSPRKLS